MRSLLRTTFSLVSAVYLCGCLVAAIPAHIPVESPDARLAFPSEFASPARLQQRQQQDQQQFATFYGFGNMEAETEVPQDGATTLAPLSMVFMAMAQSTQGSSPTGANLPQASTTNSAQPTISRSSALVSPQASLQDGLSTPTAASRADTTRPRMSYSTIVVLGCIIGSIAMFTICLFIFMDPRIARMISWRRSKRQIKPLSSKASNSSWKTTRIPPPLFLESSLEKSDVRKSRGGDVFVEVPLHTAASKFSVSSSDYDSRESYVSSFSASSACSLTIPPRAATTAPVRPPRPPTADSPTLSESVYLACSDQPYIIVSPQPLTPEDLNMDTPPPTPSRILTPTEFAEMHLTGTLPKAEHPPPGLAPFTSKDKEESAHSRTRSAPTLKFLGGSKATPKKEAEIDQTDRDVGDVGVRDAIMRRVTKHRRSRSASGWAYPDRPKTRRRNGA